MNLRLNRASQFLEKTLHPAIRVINGVGAVCLSVMMLLTVAEVVLRHFFNRPIKGTLELTEFLMIIVVFLAMGYTAMLRGHVVIDILTSRLRGRPRAIGDSIAHLISIGFCCLMIWQGVAQAEILQGYGDISPIADIPVPIFPFMYVLVLGSGLMGLVFLANLLDSLKGVLKK